MKYTNPIIPGFYPDPSICLNGNDYYLVTSSFEYFPGVPVFHSRDLAHWEQIGHCLSDKTRLPLDRAKSSSGIYAPTIRFSNGRFYMVTTNNHVGKNFFVYTDDIRGQWSEPVWIDSEGIDPSFFFDDDGKVYYTKTLFENIVQSEIDVSNGKIIGKSANVWKGTGGRFTEAPHLYKINGIYYLMLAEGGTEYGHMVTIARSATPWGPFEPCPFNPVLTHRNRGMHAIQATGHADLIQASNGSLWMVFLGIRANGYPPVHHLGRETFLAPVGWSGDGWPVVGNNGTVELEMNADLPASYDTDKEPGFDDFDAPEMKPSWNYLRNPYEPDYSLSDRPGSLRLNCSPVSLNDIDSPTFVGRRQRHFDFTAKTKIDFRPHHDGEEAGMTVFMNERHHYEIALARFSGSRCIIVRKTIGDLSTIVFLKRIGEREIILCISGNIEIYRFAFGTGASRLKETATGQARYLSTEVAGGFTGVYIALYATSNGKKKGASAYFDWFDYDTTS